MDTRKCLAANLTLGVNGDIGAACSLQSVGELRERKDRDGSGIDSRHIKALGNKKLTARKQFSLIINVLVSLSLCSW